MFGTFSIRPLFLLGLSLAAGLGFSSCSNLSKDHRSEMIVSVRDQTMLLVQDGKLVQAYRVSTSKFGIGNQYGSNRTPLGKLEVARKIGDGLPPGAVIKNRRPTGEILSPDAPGRDPIVSRILWLNGTETQNRNSYQRYIYIHGTPEERLLGTPASYGCVRMGCNDVVDLYKRVGNGASVQIIRGPLTETAPGQEYAARMRIQTLGVEKIAEQESQKPQT